MITTQSQDSLLMTGRQQKEIVLAHGGGGQLTDELLDEVILPRLGNAVLSNLLDAGVISTQNQQLAVTTDGFVVQPLFFPGGDIGQLAVCGTVNDLAVSGARPMGLALGMILTEGLAQDTLEQVLDSVASSAAQAGVQVVTGDTKVIERSSLGGLYLTTTGFGWVAPKKTYRPENVRAGDVIIINGSIADHGLAVMLAREMPHVSSVLRSDVAPLNHLIESVSSRNDDIVFMRDPTRGGLTGVAVELAQRSGYHIVLEESCIPLRPETAHAAEMLGFDPLEVANEGKVVLVVRPESQREVLALLHDHPLGEQACVIGQVETKQDGLCELRTVMGGRRLLQKPYGEQLPRIC